MSLLVLAHQHGQAAHGVPGRDDLSLLGEDEQGHGALDHLLSVENPADQVALLVDEGGGELGGVDLARAHGHKLVAGGGEVLPDDVLGIVDDAHGGDGVEPQMGAHQQRLGVGVADAADAAAAVEVPQVVFELGAEGGILDGVDLPLESVFRVMDNHAAPAGSQMEW